MQRRRWIWAAASVLAVGILSVWFLLQSGANNNISTRFGEVRQVSLPDQTLVTLNANSKLEYKKQWKKGEAREVWLKGEAFFEVTHLNRQGQPIKEEERFIVHAEGIKVQVLGTSFNVNDRDGFTKVLLQSGSVQIDFDDKNKESIILKPGDVAKLDRRTKDVIRETANGGNETSWKKKELRLDNTSFADIISRIENYYGYKVKVEDERLLGRQVSGTGASSLSLEDEETLFKSLEIILSIKIDKKDKTIYIKNR
jgi:ferric-dicitrate binding protein FerR (iron transport regulator)